MIKGIEREIGPCGAIDTHGANKRLSAMVAATQSHAMSVEVATYLLSGKSRYRKRNNTATVLHVRLRTDYLFRLANQNRSLVIGTDNLSKLALGWCTYGVRDQILHYNVNASVPKTLVQHSSASLPVAARWKKARYARSTRF